MKGALNDITVLDFSRLLPGPYCSMILADHGARVISVEDHRYKADGYYITPLYRNKQHITLNLKTNAGKKIFFELAQKADVILEGFRPGVAQKLGVDYDTVLRLNPEIIYCSITGYGQTGGKKDLVGHDVNYLSYSGVLDLMGEQNRCPSIPGVQFADIAAGGMNAALGILLALFHRSQSGRGQFIDISMTDGMVSFLPVPLHFFQKDGGLPKRGASLLSHKYACYNTYETADKKHISVGALEGRFWKKLCYYLGFPEYESEQFNEKRRDQILGHFKEAFKKKTQAQWNRILEKLDACYSPVQDLSDVLQSGFLRKRKMIMDFSDRNGEKITAIGVPIKLSKTPGSLRTPPVGFGESTTDVLRELGYNENQIQNFHISDVI
ncbi:MAG: CoA transferase [Proteobacteria bacterium]|nr:CoA transferase [Pseudomonadota bacterium]MBU1582851.1 CoA transferase [Pseudomonadota bacterium]MBU2454100.1 CoA transferase [Pseudomonadota bacterium]MBU2630454.1 CoA transferase [Pseudomonadota bacterium]